MCLQTDLGVKALVLREVHLLHFYCMSEEKIGVNFNDFSCSTLKCREAHVSYIECLSGR